uniref:Endonuclease/exonuclease/phosphatase domain-containing protein n=1 Tax=Plectus sambesii TaxID=2011161 RepID=A0A914WAH4_9BILA
MYPIGGRQNPITSSKWRRLDNQPTVTVLDDRWSDASAEVLAVASNMATPSRNLNPNARASPGGDARRHRLNDARSGQGLPGHGRTGLKKLVQHLRLATINVGSLTGRGRELADMLKRRRVDIACVQETKWKGSKARDLGEGYKLYFNGTTSNRNGIGVIVSEKFRDYVTEVSRVSDRLMSIKIDTGPTTLRVVSCYAPQTGCPDADKDAFWLSVDAHIHSCGANEHLLLGGDLNGHVGDARDGYDHFHGGNGFGR